MLSAMGALLDESSESRKGEGRARGSIHTISVQKERGPFIGKAHPKPKKHAKFAHFRILTEALRADSIRETIALGSARSANTIEP